MMSCGTCLLNLAAKTTKFANVNTAWRGFTIFPYSHATIQMFRHRVCRLPLITNESSLGSVRLHFERYPVSSAVNFCSQSQSEEVQEEEQPKEIDPLKERKRVIPPDVSIRYMESRAYKTTYGDEEVWVKYRRNHKGQFAPKLTRPACVVNGVVKSGNPCPICRDEYLVPHYTNIKLLKQFISKYTEETLTAHKTGVCEKKQLELEVAIEKAKYYGLITFKVPFRTYNYADFYPQLKDKTTEK